MGLRLFRANVGAAQRLHRAFHGEDMPFGAQAATPDFGGFGADPDELFPLGESPAGHLLP